MLVRARNQHVGVHMKSVRRSLFMSLVLVASFVIPGVVDAPSAHAVTTFTAPACTTLVPLKPAGCVPSVALTNGVCPSSASTAPDATANMNAWLANTVTNNSNANLVANRCYHTDGTVLFAAKTNVVFDGKGSTIRMYADSNPASSRTLSHLTVRGNANVTVQNLRIAGSATGGYDANREAQHGIYILGNNTVTIDNETVDHVWGDFVALQKVNSSTPTHISVLNSNFGAASTGNNGAGRQEISIDDGNDVWVSGNYFGHGSRSAVDIEPTSTGAVLNQIEFSFNSFGPNTLSWFANHGANATITSVWFIANNLDRTMGVDSVIPEGVTVDPSNGTTYKRSDYEFIDNVSTVESATGNCPDGGDTIRLWGVRAIQISGNRQPMAANRCQYLLRAVYVRNAAISDNDMRDASAVGSYAFSTVMCEARNRIGNPLHAAPISPGATAC